MPTFVIREGAIVDKRFAPPLVFGKRSGLPTPMIIRDNLDDVTNPVDGRTYSSKSAYYRAVRDAGCEIAGNDPAIMRQPKIADDGAAADVEQAYRDVAAGYKPEPIQREPVGVTDFAWR